LNRISIIHAVEDCIPEMDFVNDQLQFLLLAPANPVANIIRMLCRLKTQASVKASTGPCRAKLSPAAVVQSGVRKELRFLTRKLE
jgi:hypothetical protein